MKEISAKKWVCWSVGILFFLIAGMGFLTFLVDPYFHYHKPIAGMSYRLSEQRYINDGISRHFEYDAVITGNSLTENFKTSEFDDLFEAESIKIPYSGAGVKELWERLGRTLSYNPDVKKVLIVLDSEDVMREAQWTRYNEYPDYLYDDNVWNDVDYLFNKEVFYRGTLYNLLKTITGAESTSFDEYSSWEKETGKQKVVQQLGVILRPEEVGNRPVSDGDIERMTENIQKNILEVVRQHPDIQFIMFFPPDSLAQWCKWYNAGEIEWRLAMLTMVMEQLLEEENIQLYGFYDCYEWTCNFDYYNDFIHYSSEINSKILENISKNEHRITKDNYKDYLNEIRDFYGNYDYLSLQS